MSDNVEENSSNALVNDTQKGARMSAIVKTLMVSFALLHHFHLAFKYTRNWLTGRADVDNYKKRLETDHIMLGFFNSMYSANNNFLREFQSNNAEIHQTSLRKKLK